MTLTASLAVRRARTPDVVTIRSLMEHYAPDRRLLSKATVLLYEDVQEFVVTEAGGEVVACAALHVMWEDLAEVRTVAVRPDWVGRGAGTLMVQRLVERARDLGVRRLFCLTFEVDFFERFGFEILHGPAVRPEVYEELLQSEDEGVAEFLDLERVKPNTLGNTRMILRL